MKEIEKIFRTIEPEPDSIIHGLTLHDLDLTFLGESINKAIEISATNNGISKETILFAMLPIISTACGMNTFIDPGVVPGKVKPNLFCVNVLKSGAAKSQISSLLLGNTLDPLSLRLHTEVAEQIDSLVVDRDNGPLFNSKDRSEEKERIRLSAHKPLLSKASSAALLQYAGNGSLMLFYDELASFINAFVIGDREVTVLTELYQTHKCDKVLIGRSNTEVWDSSLSFYAHGTPEYGKQMVTPKMRGDGSSWRFCINVDIKEPLTETYEEYCNRMSKELPDFKLFFTMFNNIVSSHLQRPEEWIYKYDKEALEIKAFLSNKLKWIAGSLSEGDSLISTMLLKLPAILDKISLLHHIMKSNLGDNMVFQSYEPKIIKKDSIEFAWNFARKTFTGWNLLIQLRDSKESTDSIEKNTVKKSTKNHLIYSQILILIGGPGIYETEKWEEAIKEFPLFQKERRQKARFKKWCSEGDFALIKDNKIILKHV